MNYSKQKQFEEICNGYGFEEVEQNSDGLYCTGCLAVHKRPTKMYANGKMAPGLILETMCSVSVVHFYGDDDQLTEEDIQTMLKVAQGKNAKAGRYQRIATR